MIRGWLFLLLLGISLNAATWYAAPNADTNGTGSISQPWKLNKAFTNSSTVQSGDTLYLRGGVYMGHFVSRLNGATVRSYPGEWAIVTDGLLGSLLVDINATTNQGVFSGGEDWLAAQTIIIDSETMQLDLVAGTPVNWHINRGWDGTTNAPHLSNSVVIPKSDIILQQGSNTVFRDFEITSLHATNRVVGLTWWLGSGLNLSAIGKGNKAVNLIIHNTGHPGIGFWQQGGGGEVNGCLLWGIGMKDYSPSYAGGVGTDRGVGIYSQNEQGGMATIKNIISFRNLTGGAKVFGETGPVLNFQFLTNIVFQVSPALEGSSGSTSTSNLWFNGNLMLGTPMLSYVSRSNHNEYFINNTIVSGGFRVEEHTDSVYTNNLVLMKKGVGNQGSPIAYQSIKYGIVDINNVWDYNTYYLGNGSDPEQFNFDVVGINSVNSAGGGVLKFVDGTNSFSSWSSYDTHTTYQVNWPTNYLNVSVQRLDYDSNCWHIAVVSTSGQTNATVTPSSYGLLPGYDYRLVDAQNWPVVITSGTYGGGTINLPLNLTNVSSIPEDSVRITNEHTNVQSPGLFNAFVLNATAPPVARSVSTRTLNVGSLIQP